MQLTRTLAQMGKKSEFISGLRITDAETRDAALMVLAGRVNKSLVAAIGSHGQSAVGLSGGDGHVFRARKKKTNPDLGFVGEIAAADPRWLEAIWTMGAVPVISSIALGFDGEYYNINADEMAAACAISTKADTLVFLTDVPGRKGRGWQRHALAHARSDSRTREDAGRLRRNAAQAQRMPRCPQPRRQARTHPARRGCSFAARSLHHKSQRRNGGHGRMKLASIQAAENKLLLHTYERNSYLFVSGKGVYLQDEDGNDYLDLLSGIGVTALGYGHPAVQQAIEHQSARLIHTSNLFYHEGTAELALRLTEISGLDRVFFCNSGTEAWEAALKLARANARRLRGAGRNIGTKFLAMEHSFHGRTMGSVATTAKDKYREPFMPVMPGVEFVRFNDVADLRARFSEDVCAICIEPIQGEGGINPVSQEFFAAARELTSSTGALLLADEIQSGLGRTGKWFAYQHYGIQPDVTTLAKPIANGIPMGAMLCTAEAAQAFTPGMHGTTFGGGPLACAVAIAVIDTIRQEKLLAHINETGAFFKTKLEALAARHDCIVDVRGLGLMLGVELNSADLAKQVAAQLMERRIIINRTSETVLRFLPPYILEREHVETAINALDEILKISAAATVGAASAGEKSHG